MSKQRHYIADTTDLETDGSEVVAEVNGQEVAIYYLDEEYHAIANFCPHQSGPLCEGNRKGKVDIGEDGWQVEYSDEIYVECPWHSWMFNIKTGEHAVDDRYRVPTYDVEIEDEKLYVLR